MHENSFGIRLTQRLRATDLSNTAQAGGRNRFPDLRWAGPTLARAFPSRSGSLM